MMFKTDIIKYLFFVIFISFLYACSDEKNTNSNAENNIEYISPSNNTTNRSLHTAWSPPLSITSSVSQTDKRYPYFTQNHVLLKDSGSMFLQKYTPHDPANSTEYFINNAQNNNWKKWTVPITSSSRGVQLYHSKQHDTVFAISENNGGIYLDVYEPQDGWGTQILLVNIVTNYSVYIEKDGSLLFGWYEIDALNRSSVSFVRYSTITGISAINRLALISAPNSNQAYFPFNIISDDQGNAHIFWIHELSMTNKTLHWVKNTGVEWSIPQEIENGALGKDLFLGGNSATGDIELLIMNYDIRGQIYRKSYINGTWSAKSPLKIFPDNHNYIFATNYQGDMMFSWAQTRTQLQNYDYLENIEAISFTPQLGWQNINQISNLHKITSFGLQPTLDMNESGNVLASWSADSQIYSNYFEPLKGWGLPTVVSQKSFDLRQRPGYPVINNANKSIIVWDDVNTGVNEETHTTFISTFAATTFLPEPPLLPVDTSGVFTSNNWSQPQIAFNLPVPLDPLAYNYVTDVKFVDNQNAKIFISQILDEGTPTQNKLKAILLMGNINITQGYSKDIIPQPGDIKFTGINLISSHEKSNIVYASWDFGRYYSYQDNTGTWRNPLPLTSQSYVSSFNAISDNRAIHIWQPNNYTDYSLSAITVNPNNAGSLTISRTTLANSGKILQDDVLVDENNIVVPVYHINQANYELSFITYNPVVGWQTPTESILLLPDLHPHDVRKSNNSYVVSARFKGKSHIYVNYYDANKQWHTWENIDPNMGFNIKINSHQLVSNARGDTYILWTQEETDFDGNVVQSINMNQFIENNSPTSNWLGSQMVVETIGLSENDDFKVHLDTLGNISLAWMETNKYPVTLKYMYYDATNGWNPPEDIIQYNSPDIGDIESFELAGNDAGGTILAWIQLLLKNQNADYFTWYTIKK